MNTPEYALDEKEYRRHIDGFIDVFLDRDHSERWRSIFNLKFKAWSRLRIDRFPWQCNKEYCHRVAGSREGLSNLDFLGNPEVLLIRAGHDRQPGIGVSSLHQALSDYALIFEGIISIDPGHLAIVVDHEDQVSLCFDRKGKYKNIAFV